jgi:spore maturation protein CgeB
VRFDIVVIGLSVTSSWGNGHATTYRSLIKGLAARGHRVLFLEHDKPWYAANRDEPQPPGAVTELYQSVDELQSKYEPAVRDAALVIVGSFVPEGVRVGGWVTSIARGGTAFYDIDTPVTLAKLEAGDFEYITPRLIERYDCYFSFTGGPVLRRIEKDFGSPMARVLYCSVDTAHYRPRPSICLWDLAYLGTYSADRQTGLEELLITPAKQWSEGAFMVAGPGYPDIAGWPINVEHRTHLSPHEHPAFYASQRFTLNLTRSAMKAVGYSPSVRLFEAAACATPIISDWWEGLDSLLSAGDEVLIAEDHETVLRYLRDVPEWRRWAIGRAAHRRVLAEHTPVHRAIQVEGYLREINDHVSAHPSRGNRRNGQTPDGLGAGMEIERGRPPAGTPVGGAAVAPSGEGGLQQSTGTNS